MCKNSPLRQKIWTHLIVAHFLFYVFPKQALSYLFLEVFPKLKGDSSLAVAVATTLFDSGFDPRQRRHLIRAHLVSQLIRVQLVLLDWGSNQQNL